MLIVAVPPVPRWLMLHEVKVLVSPDPSASAIGPTAWKNELPKDGDDTSIVTIPPEQLTEYCISWEVGLGSKGFTYGTVQVVSVYLVCVIALAIVREKLPDPPVSVPPGIERDWDTDLIVPVPTIRQPHKDTPLMARVISSMSSSGKHLSQHFPQG